MQIIADLHLHSKYSRAVSPEMILPKMAEWGRKKGINLLGTGDFTHPLWLLEIKANLEERGEGIYGFKESSGRSAEVAHAIFSGTKPSGDSLRSFRSSKIGNLPADRSSSPLFLLSTEISSIYSQGGKVRRIHNVVLAPSIGTVEKINNELIKRGCNLHSDGRPIIGIPAKDLVKIILEIDERSLIIPAHVWTPWFSVYGSQSGFDSLEECFGEMAKYIYGVETGLSSDPVMNWRISELDHRSILSSSDAHSGPKLGREATVFEMEEVSFEAIREAIIGNQLRLDDRNLKLDNEIRSSKLENNQASNIQSQNPASNVQRLASNRISHTLEFYPEEGKYHYTGHRACNIKQTPEETKRLGEICSVCGKHLTVGVLHRVDQLAASRKQQVKSKIDKNGVKWISYENRPPYAMLVPLQEIIAESLGTVPASIKVQNEYNKLISQISPIGQIGGEFGVLLKTPIEEIAKIAGEKIAEGVKKVRNGEIVVDPGYDGVFGVVKIWNDEKPARNASHSDAGGKEQMSFF